MFNGRKLLIATKHQKEKVIAPILEKELGVVCIVLDNFDTDELGTFTGEIDRTEDALETAKQKCLKGMSIAIVDLAVASEGSFGPHPNIPFVHADDEILYFLDAKNDLEIFVRVLTTETNFNASTVETKKALKDFAQMAQFPSHGLIIKKAKHDFNDMEKGITDTLKLLEIFDTFHKEMGSAYVETDMRAMFNPTRMTVIEKAAQKLVQKIKCRCPECQTPGLGITAVKEGLPCSLCHAPTHSVFSYIYECQKCTFVKEDKFPNKKETEDPMYCDFCNP